MRTAAHTAGDMCRCVVRLVAATAAATVHVSCDIEQLNPARCMSTGTTYRVKRCTLATPAHVCSSRRPSLLFVNLLITFTDASCWHQAPAWPGPAGWGAVHLHALPPWAQLVTFGPVPAAALPRVLQQVLPAPSDP